MIYFFIGFLTFLFWLLFVKFIIIWTIFEAFLKEDKIWWSVLWYGNTEQCYKMASHGLNREPQTKSIAFTVLLLCSNSQEIPDGNSQHKFTKCNQPNSLTNPISFWDEMTCSVDKGSAISTVNFDRSTCFSFKYLMEILRCHNIKTTFFAEAVLWYTVRWSKEYF